MCYGTHLLHCHGHDTPPVVISLRQYHKRSAVLYNSWPRLPSKNRVVQPNPLNVGWNPILHEVLAPPPRSARVQRRAEKGFGFGV